MALSTPAEREFKVLRKGFIRDNIVLANFREGLRALINPETGNPFTEEEIARATAPGSRWYIEAQAIDDFGQGEQRNALYLADQIQLDKATGRWLLNFHGRLWDVSHLDAFGGSGPVLVSGSAGTIVVGDPVLNTPGAYKARDPAGNLYQVFATATIPGSQTVTCVLAALTPGSSTNISAGTVLTWTERDPNMQPTAVVLEDFRGGTDRETDAELASRIYSIIRYRPGAGNDPNYRAWARESSSAIEDAFVYPAALHAGSVIVTFVQKRGTAKGPLARLPSPTTLATGIAYVTPPTSPVVPARTFVIGTPPASEPSDLVIGLGMTRASSSGWYDPQPFPSGGNGVNVAAHVTVVSSPTVFTFTAVDLTLPGKTSGATALGDDAPHIALWDVATSRWLPVQVVSIQDFIGGVYEVTHSGSVTVTPQQWVSPLTARGVLIAEAIEGYFDALGPGEITDIETDPRGQRARRFPSAIEEWPYRAGASVVTSVIDALGGTIVNGVLEHISKTEPSFPVALHLGPNMLTLGKVAIYPL